MFNLQNLAAELRPLFKSAKAREEFDALLHSPEAARLSESQDAELRAERLEHAQRLAALPKRFAPEHAAASKRCAAALEREAECEDALRIARDALRTARHGADAVQANETRERFEAERALRETADGRLQEFAAWCSDLSSLCRAAWSPILEMHPRNYWTGDPPFASWNSNAEVIQPALDALQLAGDDARDLQLKVLDREAITERLNAHLHALDPLLDRLNLHTAELDAHGNFVRDRVRKPGDMLRDAIRASGGKPDAEPGDTPPAPAPKLYRGKPSVQRAARQLDQLAN